MTGAGAACYAVLDNGSNNLVTLRYRLKDVTVKAHRAGVQGGRSGDPGWLVHHCAQRLRSSVKGAIEPLGLKAVALTAAPNVPKHDVDLPRLAVYTTWGSTQDVGWVRYAFDHFELPYDLIYKERVARATCALHYDVIVIPSQGRSAKSLVFDIEPRRQARSLTPRPTEFKTLGMYGESDDITGGMGLEGRGRIPQIRRTRAEC